MMRQGTWKIIKLNMWLAREEVPATVVMMLLAPVSLFCISRDAPALLTWIYLHDHRILLFGKDDV